MGTSLWIARSLDTGREFVMLKGGSLLSPLAKAVRPLLRSFVSRLRNVRKNGGDSKLRDMWFSFSQAVGWVVYLAP